MKTKLILGMSVVVISFCTASKCRRSVNCPTGSHRNFYVKNNSMKAIALQLVVTKDTVWIRNGEIGDSTEYRLLPGETKQVAAGRGQCWEYSFGYGSRPSNYYYFFDYDTVTTLGWDKINGTNRGLLKIQEFNLQILQDNNFTLTYP